MASDNKNEAKTETPEAKTSKKGKLPKGVTGVRENVKGAGTGKKTHGTAHVQGSGTGYKPEKKPPAKLGDADMMSSSRAEDGSVRIRWYGHSITSILRWFGHMGANVATGLEWAKRIGYTISPTTMNCQITSGRNGRKNKQPGGFRGSLPGQGENDVPFTAEQKKYLLSLRPAKSGDDDEEENDE